MSTGRGPGSAEWWSLRLAREPAAVVLTDEQGTVRRWSGEAQRLYGYTRQEARGRDVADLLAPPGTSDDVRRMTVLRPRASRAGVR